MKYFLTLPSGVAKKITLIIPQLIIISFTLLVQNDSWLTQLNYFHLEKLSACHAPLYSLQTLLGVTETSQVLLALYSQCCQVTLFVKICISSLGFTTDLAVMSGL